MHLLAVLEMDHLNSKMKLACMVQTHSPSNHMGPLQIFY